MGSGKSIGVLVTVVASLAHAQANLSVLQHDGSPYGRGDDAARQRVARTFFATHNDAYDFLVVFPAFPVDFGTEVGGLHTSIRTTERGIGRAVGDRGLSYGSPSRLKGYIDVRSIALPTPNAVEDDIGILAHEVAHQWAASVRFRDPNTGALSGDLLGQDQAHWSFFLDSDASFLYGSDWRQGGGGFVATRSRRQYSSLDLYLMGLVPASEVQPLTLLRPTTSSGFTAQSLPPSDTTVIPATPTAVRIEDIIAAEGERVPGVASSQKQFRAAFIVLTAPGVSPTAAQLAHVEQVRTRFVREFFFLTRGAGLMETDLVELAPSGVAQNPGVQAAVSYLVSAQLDGGQWRDDPRTVVKDTAAAVEALSAFRHLPPVAAARARALAFFDAGVPLDSDARNRRALALADLNQQPGDASGLGSSRYASGYGRTSLDSAFALLADSTVRPISLASPEWQALKTEQLADGSWPATPGGPGRIEPTVRALKAMARLTDKGPAEDAMAARGVAFLRTATRSSGLFGDDVESVVATALAIDAMSTWGRLTGAEADATRLRLVATQQPDGSWNHRVYDTALALTALGRILVPDLAIQSATVSRNTVPAGLGTTASITIRNGGLVSSEATVVQVFDNSGTAVSTSVPVGPLAPGASATFSVPLITRTAMIGTSQVSVVLDPEMTTSDAQRANNLFALGLSVTEPPTRHDLYVEERSVSFSPGVVTRLPQTVLVSVLVGNAGQTALMSAEAGLMSARVHAEASGIATGFLDVQLPAQSTQLVTVPVLVSNAPSDLSFVVRISPTDANNSNNSTTATLPLNREVAVALASVSVGATSVVQGQDAEITASLMNLGTAEARGGRVAGRCPRREWGRHRAASP